MDGNLQTLLRPMPSGEYHFNTEAAERMQIVAGHCKVMIDGQGATKSHAPGDSFDVPAQSGFTIAVEHGICEYICSFLG
jgi:uncharacterized protein YaiE (UPF0345 family)